MQKEYPVQSDRYHNCHKFVRKENGNYDFIPEKDWMPIYVTSSEDGKRIEFIDSDGGPVIGRGFKNSFIEVVDIITNENNDIEFILKEL